MMIKSITACESMHGYDIIKATIRDFRQIARKVKRFPNSELYFRLLTEYIRYMQMDEVFIFHFDDVQDKINAELEKAGLDPQDICLRILEATY